MAAMCMMLVMMPFFLLAMYEKHGQPLEPEEWHNEQEKVRQLTPYKLPAKLVEYLKTCLLYTSSIGAHTAKVLLCAVQRSAARANRR